MTSKHIKVSQIQNNLYLYGEQRTNFPHYTVGAETTTHLRAELTTLLETRQKLASPRSNHTFPKLLIIVEVRRSTIGHIPPNDFVQFSRLYVSLKQKHFLPLIFKCLASNSKKERLSLAGGKNIKLQENFNLSA